MNIPSVAFERLERSAAAKFSRARNSVSTWGLELARHRATSSALAERDAITHAIEHGDAVEYASILLDLGSKTNLRETEYRFGAPRSTARV